MISIVQWASRTAQIEMSPPTIVGIVPSVEDLVTAVHAVVEGQKGRGMVETLWAKHPKPPDIAGLSKILFGVLAAPKEWCVVCTSRGIACSTP